jgi:hypothetical protein
MDSETRLLVKVALVIGLLFVLFVLVLVLLAVFAGHTHTGGYTPR